MAQVQFSCPRPPVWADVHRALVEHARRERLAMPPAPIILSGWTFSSASDKDRRWTETKRWAEANGCGHVTNAVDAVDMVVWNDDDPAWDPREALGDASDET